MAVDGTQMVLDSLNKLSGGDPATVKTILDIADKVDFTWFEWAIKVGLVALVFLFFKDGIYNVFRYSLIRWDRYVGIGAIIKFDKDIIGRIKSYDFRSIVIETMDGFVRIPLHVWMSTYWVQIKEKEFEFRTERKEKDNLELKYYTLEQEVIDLKKCMLSTNTQQTQSQNNISGSVSGTVLPTPKTTVTSNEQTSPTLPQIPKS